MKVECDYREKGSGIFELFDKNTTEIKFTNLQVGDYIINDSIIIERKVSEDFIRSIIDARLFDQCKRLKKEADKSVLIILEGNPYNSQSKINEKAIRGAILSVLCSWQIPIIRSDDRNSTVELIKLIANQYKRNDSWIGNKIRFSKRRKSKPREVFLQGLPKVGPELAERLIKHFGSIRKIANADEIELMNVEGVGKKCAKSILDFFLQ